MNPRERFLLIATLSVGVVVGGIGGYKKYNALLSGLDADIRKANKELEKVETEVADAISGARKWRDVGRSTLSTRPGEVKNILRDEMYAMVERAGLREADVRPHSSELSFGKNGVKRYTCKVDANATIDQIVRFLYDLETQPYLLRVTSLQVKPLDPVKQPGVMSLSATVETLILPTTKLVGISELKPQPLEKMDDRDRETEDLRLEAVDNYVSVFKQELFEPYKPPLPEAVVSGEPANEAEFDVPGPQGLKWEPTSGATSYRIYVAQGRPPSQADNKPLANPAETFWRPPANFFQKGQTYHWRVDAVNESGTTPGQNLLFRIKGDATSVVDGGPQPPRVVERPPADQNLVLGRIWSGAMGQTIVLEDPANQALADSRKSVGDEVYGGRLIFVHPKGAVTENEKQGRLFHPIGAALKDNRPLTEQDQPLIFEALEKLEHQLEGISRRSGVDG